MASFWGTLGARLPFAGPYTNASHYVPYMVHFDYEVGAGGEPVREWLKGSPYAEDRKRIGADIATVEFGWPIGMPVCRPLGGGIYEVRTDLEHNRIARILFYIREVGAWFSCMAS